MDLALIERLMQLLEKSAVDTLEVTEGNLHVPLSKSPLPAPAPSADDGRLKQWDDESEPFVIQTAGRAVVVAGLHGTFYRAPSPGAAPFVTEGSVVADGDALGLIEAMKMLNPVEAETAGIVRAILLADGTPVEPGTPLFEIEKIPE